MEKGEKGGKEGVKEEMQECRRERTMPKPPAFETADASSA